MWRNQLLTFHRIISGGRNSSSLEPLENIAEYALHIFVGFSNKLVPHARIYLQCLVLTSGAFVEFLRTGWIADYVITTVDYQERNRNVGEPILNFPAHTEQFLCCRSSWPR